MEKPEARHCEECGSTKGSIGAFVLSMGDMPGSEKAGYWHLRCFGIATKNMANQIKAAKREALTSAAKREVESEEG